MADLNIGGQAVIEGVMMRSSDKISTAVRKPNGEIFIKTEDYKSLSSRYKILNFPILRGAVSFIEMMIVGIKTLNFSADIAMQEAEKEEAEKKGKEYTVEEKQSNGLMLAFSALFALIMSMFVFVFIPNFLSDLFGFKKDALTFNLFAGFVRLTLFVSYVWVISFFKDFKRIFEYHGAEHKSIYAYEMGDELTPERAATHTRLHPRCGTSFILIVALLAILIYAIADTIFTNITGIVPTWYIRTLVHISLLPLVAGISYEILKISGKTRHNPITKFLIKPGLWLQLITTNEPSADQLEVALAALKASLGIETKTTVAENNPST